MMTLLERLTVLAALLVSGFLLSGTAHAMTFNPDACLDKSHIRDCRTGECYIYRPKVGPGHLPVMDGNCRAWEEVDDGPADQPPPVAPNRRPGR